MEFSSEDINEEPHENGAFLFLKGTFETLKS